MINTHELQNTLRELIPQFLDLGDFNKIKIPKQGNGGGYENNGDKGLSHNILDD